MLDAVVAEESADVVEGELELFGLAVAPVPIDARESWRSKMPSAACEMASSAKTASNNNNDLDCILVWSLGTKEKLFQRAGRRSRLRCRSLGTRKRPRKKTRPSLPVSSRVIPQRGDALVGGFRKRTKRPKRLGSERRR